MRQGITSHHLQSGAGIGGIFRSGINLIRRFLFPAVKSIAKSSVGRSAVKSIKKAGTRVIADVLSGKAIKSSAKENFDNVKQDVSKSVRKLANDSKNIKKLNRKKKQNNKTKKRSSYFFDH